MINQFSTVATGRTFSFQLPVQFLDEIASSRSYPCQSASESVMFSDSLANPASVSKVSNVSKCYPVLTSLTKT